MGNGGKAESGLLEQCDELGLGPLHHSPIGFGRFLSDWDGRRGKTELQRKKWEAGKGGSRYS